MAGRRGKRKTASFFKIMIGDFSTQLRIPPAFIKHFEENVPRKLSLWNPNCDYWSVDVNKIGDTFFLDKGWKDFAEENRVNFGDLLLFNFHGKSAVHVKIYGSNACEKKIEKGTRKRGRIVQTKEQMKQEEAKRAKQVRGKDNLAGLGSVVSDDELHRHSKPVEIEDNVAVVSLEETLGMTIKIEEDALTPATQPQLPSQSEPPRKRKRSQPMQSFQGTGVPTKMSKRSTKLKRSLGNAAQRALEKAKAFRPQNPFFTVVMRQSYIQKYADLNVPLSFVSTHLPEMATSNVTLRVPNGRAWLMKYSRYGSGRPRARFSRGWSNFVIDNSLKIGDTCVFEKVKESEMVLEVAIFRAREEKNCSPSRK